MTVKCAWCKKCRRLYFIFGDDNGLCPNCQCDRDCEHCPFPDCKVDTETPEEIEAAEVRDRAIKKERRRYGGYC